MQEDVSLLYQCFNFISILEVFDPVDETLHSAISELGKHSGWLKY